MRGRGKRGSIALGLAVVLASFHPGPIRAQDREQDRAPTGARPSVVIDLDVLDEFGPAIGAPSSGLIILRPPGQAMPPPPPSIGRQPEAPPEAVTVKPPPSATKPLSPGVSPPPSAAIPPAKPAASPDSGAAPAAVPATRPGNPPTIDAPLIIGFESTSAALTDVARAQLATLAELLGAKEGRIQIKAFASAGADGASGARRLSLDRALETRSFLIGRGLRGASIDVRALGMAGDGVPADRVEIVTLGR